MDPGSILLVFVLIVLATVAFAVWACVRLLGWLFRAITGTGRPAPRGAYGSALPGAVGCGHPRCGAANVAHARFCRRCGRAIGAGVVTRPAPMRYVA